MEDKIIHERYRELACAIILRQVQDYLCKGKKYPDCRMYNWVQSCSYFDYLGIDRDYFYRNVKAMKDAKRGKITKGVGRYGKTKV